MLQLRFKFDKTAYDYYYYLKHQKGNKKYLAQKNINSKRWAAQNPLKSKLCKRLSVIKQRCKNKKYKDYRWYGAKGIKCFLTTDNMIYMWKRDRASLMENPSIDRVDNNGHYLIENCRFIESSENLSRRYKNG